MKNLNEETARELLNEFKNLCELDRVEYVEGMCRPLKHYSFEEGNIESFLQKKFPKLEVGKWYKSTYHTKDKMLIFPEFISKTGNLYGYGFDDEGSWFVETEEKSGSCLCNNEAAKYLIPATHKEVEQALIAEAKRRGFKEGVKSTSVDGSTNVTGLSNEIFWKLYIYRDRTDTLVDGDHNYAIFYKGKWAEIIHDKEEKEEITLDQIEKDLKKLAKSVRQLRNNL